MRTEEDLSVGVDRGESITLMGPNVLSDDSCRVAHWTDLAVELAAPVTGFQRSPPRGLRPALRDLLRSMNCY